MNSLKFFTIKESIYTLTQNEKEAFKVDWSLTELYNKEKIDLYNKGIKKIPNLSMLKNLQELSLSYNKIEKIPETLPNSLEILYLSDNKIEKIPETLPNSLQLLHLSNNKIEKIPKKYKNIIIIL